MKAIVTGGGTGGHIYPAIAIADEIMREYPDGEVLYVGTATGMEADFVPTAGYDIEFIHASGFDRKRVLKNIKTVNDMLTGEVEARAILKKFKPDFVLGTGGYVSVPMLRVAQFEKVPTFIHEQNAFSGMANKLLNRGTNVTFVAFEAAKERFPDAKRIEVVGNPVRAEFETADRAECRKKMRLSDDEFGLLCFGGSLGALMLNRTFSLAIPYLLGEEGGEKTKIFYATGKMYYEEYKAELYQKGIPFCSLEEYLAGSEARVILMPYIQKMYEMLPAMDLVISRAGALTVAEITVSGRASIMIPSPNVTENHQFYNAKAIADRGGCTLLEEKNMDVESLVSAIDNLRMDPDKRRAMEDAAREAGIPDAAKRIVKTIVETI